MKPTTILVMWGLSIAAGVWLLATIAEELIKIRAALETLVARASMDWTVNVKYKDR